MVFVTHEWGAAFARLPVLDAGIFSLTDMIHRGAAQNHTLPSVVTNVVSA